MPHSTDYEYLLWYQTGMGLKPPLCSLLAVGPQTSSSCLWASFFCRYEMVICTTPAFLWELICLELLALGLAHGWSWRNQSYNCYWLIFPFMCLSSLSNLSPQRPVQISSGHCSLLTRKRQRYTSLESSALWEPGLQPVTAEGRLLFSSGNMGKLRKRCKGL